MDYTAIGVGVATVGYAVWTYIRTQNRRTKVDKLLDHQEVDKTAHEIISYYKQKIEILEAQHVDNEARISALEAHVAQQTKILEQQKKYIESLVELVQGRDPAIQAFLKVSETTLEKFNGDTAPKVDQIHEHLIHGKKVSL